MPWAAFSTGFLLCATLIIAIGAQNAYVLRQGLRREHIGAIVLFCSLSDLLLIGAGVAGLARLLRELPTITAILTAGGATFLLWYGVRALVRARRPQHLHPEDENRTRSLASALTQVAAFTFLNPHVYLDTLLLMGTVGAEQPSGSRAAFVAGAASASVLWFTALGFGARWLAPLFARPRAWQALDVLIGLTMLALCLRLAYQGVVGSTFAG